MATRSFMMPDIREPHGEIMTRLWLLVPLRLYVGIYLILAAIAKVRPGGGMLSDPTILADKVGGVVNGAGYSYPFYQAIFQYVIEPNIGVFVFLVVFGELLVGLSIVSGTLLRPACAAGLFMVLNFFLAFNQSLAMPGNSTSFAVILLVLLATGAGRTYGVDHYLRGKLPRWMV